MALRRRTREASSTIYKVCSLLLSYPDDELLGARGELREAVEQLPSTPARTALERFCEWWCTEDPLTLQQRYVATFDLEKRCGLYLTFYGEGDRRERGMALLRLRQLYRAAGLPQDGRELPDYLPVMLEFAASAPSGRGELVLREHRAALELVRQSLHDRDTPWAGVLDAVTLTLGDLSAADRARAIKLAASGPPSELVGLEPFGAARSASGLAQRRAAPKSSGSPPEVMPTEGARR